MPYASIKDAPKSLIGAGLTLAQMNTWAKVYDQAKAWGARNPAGVAWTAFKKKYKKVGDKWIERKTIKKIIFTHWGTEAIGMSHSELAKKISKLSQEFCFDIPIEIAVDNMILDSLAVDELGLQEQVEIEEFALSNYIGSKRKFVKDIFKWIPQKAKTFLDPACGTGTLLIEAAKNGMEVIGNDLSPMAYLYCAGIFEGEILNEEDITKFKNFLPVSGWLSKSKLKRPERLEARKIFDGLIIGAWIKFSKEKRKTALASLSLLLQKNFRSFRCFIREKEPYEQETILKELEKAIREINALISEVGGKGKIFNRDILKEKIPIADVIYFDPPYFPSGIKTKVGYFEHYKILNSCLMQRAWKYKDPSKEDLVNFLPKLAEKSENIILSSASPSEIDWETELKKYKTSVKKIELSQISSGSQPQGNRTNAKKTREFKENLFLAGDKELKLERELEMPLFELGKYKPQEIEDKKLMNDLKLLSAKWSSILLGKRTEFKNKEELINFTSKIVEEILERDRITFSKERIKESSKQLLTIILEKLVKNGLPLATPYAELVWKREKDLIVREKELNLSKFKILCDFNKKAFGFIRLEKPKEVRIEEFGKLETRHRISEKERERLFPNNKNLYVYKIRDFFSFNQIRKVKNYKALIQEVLFKREEFDPRLTAEELKKLSNEELISLHAQAHKFWEERGSRASDELVINAHILILEEMRKRGMEHRMLDKLDEISAELKGLRVNEPYVYIDDLKKIWGDGFILKEPFLAVIGSTVVSGRGEDIDVWVNLPVDKNAIEKLLGALEFRLRSFLNENLNGKIHLVPDPEGKYTNFLPLARLKVEFIKPEERELVPMSKESIQVGKAFVPLKTGVGYGVHSFFDKEELWKKWMQKYLIG